MADKSGIEWTDATWNPVSGCAKVSPGCAHCYAETVAARFWPTQYVSRENFKGLEHPWMYPPHERGREFTDVMCHEDRLDQPLRWRKPRKVFVNSMSDLFHEDVPDAFIDRVFAVMALSPSHTFQVLTKRADRMRDYVQRLSKSIEPLEAAARATGWTFKFSTINGTTYSTLSFPIRNVWLGVSVENQHFADERIPLVLRTPAAVRFVSYEPALGPVNFSPWLQPGFSCVSRQHPHACGCGQLDWVIVGGESGPKARPCDVAWVRTAVQQCKSAGVACFVKQLGAWATTEEFHNVATVNGFPQSDRMATAGNRLIMHDRKGGDPAEWPEDIRVREFPAVRS